MARKQQIKSTSNLMIEKIGYVSNADCDIEYGKKEDLLNTQYYHKTEGPELKYLPYEEKNKIKQFQLINFFKIDSYTKKNDIEVIDENDIESYESYRINNYVNSTVLTNINSDNMNNNT